MYVTIAIHVPYLYLPHTIVYGNINDKNTMSDSNYRLIALFHGLTNCTGLSISNYSVNVFFTVLSHMCFSQMSDILYTKCKG